MEKVSFYIVRNNLTRKAEGGKVYHTEDEARKALETLPLDLQKVCEVKSYVGEKIQS